MNISEVLNGIKVEWKSLGEVCEVKRGRVISKEYLENNKGEFPVYSSQTVNNGEIGSIDTFDYEGEYGSWTTDGANAGTVFYREGKFSITNICGLLNPNRKMLNVKFLVYFLQLEAKKHVKGGSGNPKLMSNVMKNIPIPIPSLEMQEKIVKVLDKLTDYVTKLTVRLTTELRARKKQYAYYRDMLFSEEYLNKLSETLDNVEGQSMGVLTTLGEIGTFTRGNGLQKKDFTDKGRPVIHYGQIFTRYGFSTDQTVSFTSNEIFTKLKKAQPNDIVMASTSENIEDVGKSVVWLGNKDIGISGDSYVYSTSQNSKYVAYFFQTAAYQKQKERKVTGTKVIRINAKDMEKFEIPLPSLAVQAHVVGILDKFDALTNELTQNLLKEIELRKKQYEYYRKKLLTFE